MSGAILEQHRSQLTVRTPGRGLVEITDEVRARVAGRGIRNGLLTLLRHTCSSLLIQENADPEVRAGLERFFARLVRDGESDSNGPDPRVTSATVIAARQGRPVVR